MYSVDNSERWDFFIRAIARKLNFEDRIVAVKKDATKFVPDRCIDFVIAELVFAGLVREPLVQAAINIQNYVSTSAKFLPESAVSTIKLYDEERKVFISETKEYDNAHLPSINRLGINREIELKITEDGVPSHAVLETVLHHPNGRITAEFESLCKPLYLPLRYINGTGKKLIVKKIFGSRNDKANTGETIIVKIAYNYGSSNLQLGARLKNF